MSARDMPRPSKVVGGDRPLGEPISSTTPLSDCLKCREQQRAVNRPGNARLGSTPFRHETPRRTSRGSANRERH